MDWVVVPARDEEARIAACLGALSAQPEARAGRLGVVVVLDGCRDRTAAEVTAAARRSALRVVTTEGPGAGPGPARRHGMSVARELADPRTRLLLSTDADTRVAPDWVGVQRRAVRERGAQAIGGRILLDPVEAALLADGVVAARTAAAVGRLAAVRRHAPEAEHHHFSGGSLSITPVAYDLVGGIPAVTTLEDEALERELRRAGIAIHYLEAVRVVTSARTDGRARLGLSDALAAWERERAVALP
ncbi:hypothetical protein DSM112329_01894 [Paraconexibacter sp. AEG42_29]|uniref:4,4'-diaponeurosporenoate glycosyltransferase n=1 Tax=Paraconexibacter sp. AEG42_29 TaxID=2997339 RepID=A0AAU7ATP6_9ACTN